MNLINNSKFLHNSQIFVGNRITLFKTMIENKNNESTELPKIQNTSVNISTDYNENNNNNNFNSEEYFNELNKIHSQALEKEIEIKRKKKEKHYNLINPIINQILDIVKEVGKYQNENNIDLINKETWDDLTKKMINNEIIDSDLLEIRKKMIQKVNMKVIMVKN